MGRLHAAAVSFTFWIVGQIIGRWALNLGATLKIRWAADPPKGPVVIVANHRSFLDPFLVGVTWPVPAAYFARGDLWRYPVIGTALRFLGGIPVNRSAVDRDTVQAAVKMLRAGRRLVVFPEGTRTKTGRLGKLRQGPALFARRAGVPILPVYLRRTEAVWPRGSALPFPRGSRLEVRYGRAVRAPAHLSGRQQDEVMTAYLERWFAAREAELEGPGGG
jgi:1-acyl-sn-glycerol-3-phosphate acyltransferase